MKLINLDDFVVIGPGSEWLWTAVSGIVMAVTFLAIYRQLRAQRAANASAQLKDHGERWQSERMRTVLLRVAIGLKSGDDQDTEHLIGSEIVGFFEEVDSMHHQGFLETEVLFATLDLGINAVRWWTVVEPVVRKARAVYGPAEAAGFERLAGQMRGVMARKGFPEFKTDPDSVAERIEWIIDGLQQRARLEKEIAAGVVRPLPASSDSAVSRPSAARTARTRARTSSDL